MCAVGVPFCFGKEFSDASFDFIHNGVSTGRKVLLYVYHLLHYCDVARDVHFLFFYIFGRVDLFMLLIDLLGSWVAIVAG